MSKYNQTKKLVLRDYLSRALVFVAAVALIVYFLPREGRFNYQFDVGKPWRYSPLIASFDFPIYKDSNMVQRERDSLMNLYQPYFQIDNNVEKEQVLKLRKAFNTTLKDVVPFSYFGYLTSTMHALYGRGIISSSDFDMLQVDSIRSIRVVADKQASVYPTDVLMSTKSAYELLMNVDTTHYDRAMLQRCNLNEYIVPNLILDEEKSNARRKDLLNNLSFANGMVIAGQKIVDRGEIITSNTYNILESFHKESVKRSDTTKQMRVMLVGQIIFVMVAVMGFVLYLNLFRKDYFDQPRCLLLLFSMIVLFPISASFLVSHNLYSVFMIPYAMLPLFVRVFLDSRTATMAHLTMVLLCSVALRAPYEFILVQVMSGLAAIYSLRELSQRSQLIRSAAIVTAVAMLCYLSVELIRENDFTKLDKGMYTYFVINGILLLFAYPLMFLIEKLFGFTSNVTLVELSNINSDLLRKMSEVAPGTFQHSMQVANLAAEVANKIGARSQLVRTGALYHDVGKIERPAFFTENQVGINPHERLRFDQSAQVIIAHVKKGLELADKYRLPRVIKDFIATHHGTGKTKYFYISYKNKYPDVPVDDAIFTYPGPNPFTLEQAILMMADSVEAASHSLKEYTEDSLTKMVNSIIDGQVADGFFHNCPITFADIAMAKEVFAEKLRTIYHTRITYPELKQEAAKPANPAAPLQMTEAEAKEEES